MQTVLSAPITLAYAGSGEFVPQRGWFTRDDLPIAERVASHIALVMSHHCLAEQARSAAEANSRAERLESRVQQLTDELDVEWGYGLIGESP